MTTKFGHIFFAISFIFFGLQHFLYVLAVHGPVAGPPWILARPLWAAVTAAFLLLVGVLLATKRITQFAASLLAAVLFLYVIFLYVPGLVRHLHDPGRWTSAAELTCLCGAALVLAGLGTLGRILYGVPLIVFGIQHFLYAQFISTLIPVWIPRRLFWAYFVGTAFIAAAVSIATKGQARLAAILLGAMFLSWVIIVHAPRVAAHLRNGNEWTSAFIALAMCGGAWIVAGSGSQ
ncbi:MAG TPA: hypothetical protein VN684_01675 [Terriglobales bacterium]|nr:hypothetical protein [Terriglobales bacterium]